MQQNRHRFALYMEQMKGLSPLEKLNQGYAYMEDENGQKSSCQKCIEQVQIRSDHLSAYVTDGSRLQMTVDKYKGGSAMDEGRKIQRWKRCFRNWIEADQATGGSSRKYLWKNLFSCIIKELIC